MCLVQKLKLDITKTVFLGGKENFYNAHLKKRKTCLDYHNITVIHLTFK